MRYLFIGLAFLLGACSAQADPPSMIELQRYFETNSAASNEAGNPPETWSLETHLSEAIRPTWVAEEAIENFIQSTGYSRADALIAIDALLAINGFFESCLDESCLPSRSPEIRAAIETAGQLANARDILLSLASWSGELGYNADIISLLADTPDAASIYRESFFETHNPIMGIAALAYGVDEDAFLEELLANPNYTTAPAVYLTIYERLAERFMATDNNAAHARATNNFLWHAGRADLVDQSLNTVIEFARRTGHLPFDGPADFGGDYSGFDPGTELALAILSFAIEAENTELELEIRAWLEPRISTLSEIRGSSACADFELPEGQTWSDLDRDQRCRFTQAERGHANARASLEFLTEYKARALSDDEAFEMFFTGSTELSNPWELHPHWFGSSAGNALNRLKRSYLESLGLNALAESIHERISCPYYYRGEPRIPETVRRADPTLAERVDYFEAEIESRCRPNRNRDTAEANDPSVLPNPRPAYFRERPIAEARPDAESPAAPTMPELEYPVVRASFSEGEWTAVFISRAVDPGGEVSAGGYWLTRTENNGAIWGEEYYLGLQPNFPYVVVSDSDVPLFIDGHVQIEVEVQEIDRSSITFPPIGMRLTRTESGLFLDFAWTDLIRDQDEDGLTDIFEHRIGLDYTVSDHDRDGLRDSFDPLPTARYDPDSEDRTDFYTVMLEPVIGADAGAILVPPRQDDGTAFDLEQMMRMASPENRPTTIPQMLMISGDPEAFADLRWTSVPFIIQSREVFNALNAEYGPTYPVSFPVIQANGSETAWFVEWSASWVGGAFIIRLVDGQYQLTVTSSWIT